MQKIFQIHFYTVFPLIKNHGPFDEYYLTIRYISYLQAIRDFEKKNRQVDLHFSLKEV